MSTRDRLDRALNRVPGYAGYRDKERRRDSDRAIRAKLATDYGQLADRLGRLGNRLAENRKIDAVGIVDKPLTLLRSFIDRVRVATYGYAPAFANDVVDAAVLDQIAAFDSALADQIPTLEEQIASLESADPSAGEFRAAADQIGATVQQLSDRFDRRAEVIHAGRPLPEKDMLALLGPAAPDQPSELWTLRTGDAVSYNGQDYSVIGHVTAGMSSGSRRAYQLRGGDGRQWLEVGDRHDDPLAWLTEAELQLVGRPPSVKLRETDYAFMHETQARGEVEGRQGSDEQSLRYLEYGAGTRVLHIYQWGTQYLALEGVAIDLRDIELYPSHR